MRFLASAAFLALLALSVRADEFPAPTNSGDEVNLKPTSPADAVAGMQLPEGFRATLFAAEPDIQNPIGMTWDARGRLWVAENYTYSDGQTRFDLKLRDRVLILEDKDGDGRMDSRKVFVDDLQILTSVEVGHGGVWVMCPPKLLFIPDADRDDVPDGPPQTVLDGFHVFSESYHNFANGLKWGPDGWLYGRCGGSCPGEIGPPRTPEERRVPLRGGMWRYHPTLKRYETLNTGTTNPWGHDWDALGELFFVNTVNGHFWHSIPGAHMVRNGTLDPNPRVYQLLDQHADHWHFDTGKGWQDSRDGKANDLGGGHAHSGAMIYLGENWPEAYRGNLFTVNLHGRRINQEIIARHGSGYVASHAKDLMVSGDPWFRALDLTYGPDGAVMVIDWSDTGECHERNGVHRLSGRIYRISHRETPLPPDFDLRRQSSVELARSHLGSEWPYRQTRLILTERRLAGESIEQAPAVLRQVLSESANPVIQVRAMLSLYSLDQLQLSTLVGLLTSKHEAVRVWAIRLLTDRWPLDGPLGPVPYDVDQTVEVAKQSEQLTPIFAGLAANDPSGMVRLALASTLQRLPVRDRPQLARALVRRAEDADDHNLPLLVWYGLIPAADASPQELVAVAKVCQWPTTRKFIARRLGEETDKSPQPIGDLIEFAASQDATYQHDVLSGLTEALRGWRKARPPEGWRVAQPKFTMSLDPKIQELARELAVVFGDGRALDELKAIAMDKSATPSARQNALTSLIESRPPELRSICEKLVGERFVNVIAARGLAQFDDPAIGEQLVKAYRSFRAPERPQIMSILVSRPVFAEAMLKAVAAGKIPKEDLTAFHVRQLHSLGDARLKPLITEVWGELRDSPAEKKQQIAELKAKLTDDVLATADLSKGRATFSTICAKCHKLYGEGQAVGPDLTGSNRSNLDYLLENILDPSAVVNKDFRMTVVALQDGRVLNGLVTEKTEKTITLQSLTEKVTIDKSDIDEQKMTSLSPMPEGLLQTLSFEQVRDLFAYLRHHSQVKLPAGETQTP
jgi:putative membrane-bound dehydrogenase-like protein